MRSMIAKAGTLLLAVASASAQTYAPGPTMAAPFNVSAEVLVLWLKQSPTPVPIITDGLYGQPGTATLLGGGSLDTNPNPGLRVAAAYASSERLSIEGSFFYVGQRSTNAGVA